MASSNQLFPVFFRLDRMRILIVGAGEVAYEKLFFLLKSSPVTDIQIVAPAINPDIRSIISEYPETNFTIKQRGFNEDDIYGRDIIIAATNIKELNKDVWRCAKTIGKMINVADTPELCDFYLGSIVTKGDLKIAISTNGKSPTLAKRIRQVLEEVFPEDVKSLLENLHSFRKTLKTNFEKKVKILNELTESMLVTNKKIENGIN